MTEPAPVQFFAMGIGKYQDRETYPDLEVNAEIRRVRRILAPLGIRPFPEWRARKRGKDAVTARLRDWAASPAEVAVFYWVGHGWSNQEESALAHALSPRAAAQDGVTPKDLATAIGNWATQGPGDPVIIVILDACRSGRFVEQLHGELNDLGVRLPLLLIGTADEEASTRLPGFRHILDYLFDKVYKGVETVNLADFAQQVEIQSQATFPVYPIARRVADRSLTLHWPSTAAPAASAAGPGAAEEAVVLGPVATRDRQIRRIDGVRKAPATKTAATYQLFRAAPTRSWSRDVLEILGPPLLKPMPGPDERQITRVRLRAEAGGPGGEAAEPHVRAKTGPAVFVPLDVAGAATGQAATAILQQLSVRADVPGDPQRLLSVVKAFPHELIVVVRGLPEAADRAEMIALLRRVAAQPATRVVVDPGSSAEPPVAFAAALYSARDVESFTAWHHTWSCREPAFTPLLVVLAVAVGPGLPLRDRILLELAEAVADEPVSIDFATAERFLDTAKAYLTRTVDDGQAVYRLAKNGYGQALLDISQFGWEELQLRVTQRCLEIGAAQLARAEAAEVPPRTAVNPYVRRHTRRHAELAGPEGQALLASRQDHLRDAIERVHTEDAELLARLSR